MSQLQRRAEPSFLLWKAQLFLAFSSSLELGLDNLLYSSQLKGTKGHSVFSSWIIGSLMWDGYFCLLFAQWELVWLWELNIKKKFPGLGNPAIVLLIPCFVDRSDSNYPNGWLFFALSSSVGYWATEFLIYQKKTFLPSCSPASRLFYL